MEVAEVISSWHFIGRPIISSSKLLRADKHYDDYFFVNYKFDDFHFFRVPKSANEPR